MSSLVEAKNMYLRKLVKILSPEIYSGFKTMYDDVRVFCKENNLKEVISYFQKELEKIPQWSRDRMTEETLKIQSNSDCDYLLDIITALLMVNTKILLKNKIDLQIPQLYIFIHRCYKLIGRELWSNPELMENKGSSSERQRNYNYVMSLIHQGINDTIQFYLPMKPILNQYLHQNNQDSYDDIELSEEETESEDNELSEEESESEGIELSDEELETDDISSMTAEPDRYPTFFEDATDIVVDDE